MLFRTGEGFAKENNLDELVRPLTKYSDQQQREDFWFKTCQNAYHQHRQSGMFLRVASIKSCL